MNDIFEGLPFKPADILLPRDCDLSLWSVVACDQYTSRPEYWQRVENRVGRDPSSLRLILPESCLEGPSVETDIMEINNTMSRYLREGRFQEYPNSLIYVERTLHSGKTRRGLIGMVDLEQYDYEPGSTSAIRSTEGTVMSRIPPRVAVRKNAPIELPHTMLLVDDPHHMIIEPLSVKTGEMEPLYDFQLMERGGRVKGWRLTQDQMAAVAQTLQGMRAQADRERGGLLFAVGDGNHSLATAKACYERRKGLTDPGQWPGLPSRYALCELVNLHDDSLEFEPIHRVAFGVKPEVLLDAMGRYYPDALRGRQIDPRVRAIAQCISFVYREGEGEFALLHSASLTEAGALHDFLDQYLERNPRVRVDYIHGEAEARALAREREDAVAFLLPAMDKGDLFPSVLHHGALPRKTFSMGEAHDKRFYLEARKIRK